MGAGIAYGDPCGPLIMRVARRYEARSLRLGVEAALVIVHVPWLVHVVVAVVVHLVMAFWP
jgi:hypothetical protein